jgi:hypothetical protein
VSQFPQKLAGIAAAAAKRSRPVNVRLLQNSLEGANEGRALS